MSELIDRKLYKKDGRDMFILVLEYDNWEKRLLLKGSVPEFVLEQIPVDFTELMETVPFFSKEKTARFLGKIALQIFRLKHKELFCFDKSFLNRNGRINPNSLQKYQEALWYLNHENPSYVSYRTSKELCIYFKSVYLRARTDRDNFTVKSIHRVTFEKSLETDDQKKDYIDCYKGLRFLKIESKCKEAGMTCAIRGNEVKLVFVDYGKPLEF